MNNASLVMEILRGEKRLTVAIYDKEQTLDEQLFSKQENRINIRNECPDPDDLENIIASTRFCGNGARRVPIPLNFDEIHGFDDLLNVICAFTIYGQDSIFRLYNASDGEIVRAYLVSHIKGQSPKITEVPLRF